jgi:hypothetical protein
VGRVHLFEWEDQPWFPRVVRDAATGYLRVAARVSGQTAKLLPKLTETLDAAHEDRLVDLCSGGGGPVPDLVGELATRGRVVSATLTDLYPNRDALAAAAAASGGRITAHDGPVDATAVPAELSGVRTMFNSFHHLRPDLARAVLADAARARRPIAVFELVGRRPGMILGMLFAPLAVLFMMPLVRPVNWLALVLTYLFPIVPLVVLWDGIVSCLRVYSPHELAGLTAGLDAGYKWDIGTIPLGPPGLHATYLIGQPVVTT